MAKGNNNNGNALGSWAFLIGLIIAVILGAGFLSQYSESMLVILILIGLIVGLLNIAATETKSFLISGAILIIVSSLGRDVIGNIVIMGAILDALLALFVPATIVVAIKNVFSLARN